ncbi:lysylphosphatidylglycerol synthase transmembrane domain-containing protein [Thermomicrobium sp.]|uniref:lysylphosphatidylglycerol synthase transmembrane domain-containing protein n=1 Tax=Thermomicrobium sp. TaxID=1969469 RepID=UPI001AFD9FB7|nr:lysylphosphatidylglycerol synthase transmembrane domain-containing protein [Thermomicrobium sp.]MBO9305731.1 flippase-like domain-containing protein [Thermomicrobium sp.]
MNESEVLGGRSVWRRILTGLAFGIAVLAGVLVVADVRAVLPVLARFSWPLVPLVLTLTTGNYLLRFLKWELFLRWVGVRHLPRTTSLSIFLAGFAMSITPGKVGEWIKALLVAKLARVPMAPIVPVVAIERLTDGIAMLVLGLASAVLGTGWGWQPLVLLGVLVLVGLWLVQQERVVIPLLRLAERVPFARKRTDAIMTVYEAARELLAWRRLLLVSGMSIVSWSLECAALFFILVGFGMSPDGQLAAVATFALSAASIAGALSLLPGGLGAAEASIAGLLIVLRPGIGAAVAAAATVAIRLGTLWFGVLVGVIALIWLERTALAAPERRSLVAE